MVIDIPDLVAYDNRFAMRVSLSLRVLFSLAVCFVPISSFVLNQGGFTFKAHLWEVVVCNFMLLLSLGKSSGWSWWWWSLQFGWLFALCWMDHCDYFRTGTCWPTWWVIVVFALFFFFFWLCIVNWVGSVVHCFDLNASFMLFQSVTRRLDNL